MLTGYTMEKLRRILTGLKLIPQLLVWIGFTIFRKLFTRLQRLVWKYNGVGHALDKAKHEYPMSAQVMNIVWKCGFDITLQAYLPNFLLTHDRFVEPEFVLQDHVDLYFITDEVAVFAEARRGVQTWRSRYGAFAYEAMYHQARRLIVMPLPSFRRLSEHVGPPRAEICFLFNTGRCGSTLFSQMFESTEECVSLSEPQAFGLTNLRNHTSADDETVVRNARLMINLLCKPVKTPAKVTSYVIKFPAQHIVSYETIRKCFPDARYLFMYRNVVPVAKSFYRMGQVLPISLLINVLASLPWFGEKLTEGMVKEFGFQMPAGYKFRTDGGVLDFSTLFWCISASSYQTYRRRGATIAAFRYEDLAAHPVPMFEAILRYCNLATELAAPAARALHHNSQEVSRFGASRHVTPPDVTPEVVTSMNRILTTFDLPKVGEDDKLDGLLGWDDDGSFLYNYSAVTSSNNNVRKIKRK